MTVSQAGISQGERRAPVPAIPPSFALSILGDICLFPSLSLLKCIEPAAGRTSRLGTGGDSPS